MNPAILLCALTTLAQVDAPVPAREAPARMTVPDGFKVTLFAGEPDVVQPIAFTFDDRGRLWVCECYSYPKWHTPTQPSPGAGGGQGGGGKDRVLIFEDTDGDGTFDKRTVFADKLSNLSGIEYGFGGIWLCSLPHLLYIPIKEGEDRPAGPPEIKLDGWDMKSGHNVFNGLKWGPDGWLYGLNGILATSKVGPPGTDAKDRVPINCGVWRYHPTRKKFEAYAWGTTNPWGLDWDEHGEMFITNCVIGHLWHVVPGGHYERMFGQDLNPNVYTLLKSCADHIHWGGGSWTDSRAPVVSGEPGSVRTRSDAYRVHSEAGGGHAHAGCMIYLGDNWPERYRNGVFMCNLHGSRINHDILERNGSSYVARHGKDFLMANDPWFRGLGIDYGPDGGVYVADWCDTGECHNYKVAHTGSGRIHKIVHGKPEHKKIDLAKLKTEELLELQGHKNEWYVRHARRLLQERAARLPIPKALRESYFQEFRKDYDNANLSDAVKLRKLWALHAVGTAPGDLLALVDHPAPAVRNWVIRLYGDSIEGERWSGRDGNFVVDGAKTEKSPVVRLAYASLLRRLALCDARALARVLVKQHDDSRDAYIPAMLWYGLEPQVMVLKGDLPSPEPDVSDWRQFLLEARIPWLRQVIARRLASQSDEALNPLLSPGKNDTPAHWHDILEGIQEALKGRRSVPMPTRWQTTYPQLKESPLPAVRELAESLAVRFGDERAVTSLQNVLTAKSSATPEREKALEILLIRPPADFAQTLQRLLKEGNVRGLALKGLAASGDPKTPAIILAHYDVFNAEEKADALETLATRPAYALALLDAIDKKRVAKGDLSRGTLRQLQALKSKEVSKRLDEVWGSLRPTSAEKSKLIAKYKASMTADVLKQADKSNGRVLFAKSCAACHRLFGEGGAVGPDITGSQRANLDYILENIIDPSAVVQREFQVAVVTTTAGRTLTALVKEDTDRALTLQTQNETIVLPKNEVESFNRTTMSMMPDGLLDGLRPEDVRDLIAYLASPVQVPKLGQ